MAEVRLLERIVVKSPAGKVRTLGFRVKMEGREVFRSLEAVLVDVASGDHDYLTVGGGTVVLRLTTEANNNPQDNLDDVPEREVEIADKA